MFGSFRPSLIALILPSITALACANVVVDDDDLGMDDDSSSGGAMDGEPGVGGFVASSGSTTGAGGLSSNGSTTSSGGNTQNTGSTTGSGGAVNVNAGGTTSGSNGGSFSNPSGGSSNGNGNGGATQGAGGANSNSGGNGIEVEGTCYAACANAEDDNEIDGWGWENEDSCVVRGGASDSGVNCDDGGGSSSSAGGNTSGSSGGSNAGSSGGNSGNSNFDCSNPGGGSCPQISSCPSGSSDCGCYDAGSALAANKCKLLNAGADVYMLASAMMETDLMDGDSYADGDNKSGDSYNSGTCKQNWGMMRECYSPWQGKGSGDYLTSKPMRTDASLDVAVYDACRSFYGSKWWAGHRAGSSGLNGTHDQGDIDRFKNAMDWTAQQLQGHESDNIRFWVQVPAIAP